MTYIVCEKVITIKKLELSGIEWNIFVDDIMNKLDIFLLNGSITNDQYMDLINIIYE